MEGKKSEAGEKPAKKKDSAASGGAQDQELEALLNGAWYSRLIAAGRVIGWNCFRVVKERTRVLLLVGLICLPRAFSSAEER